MPKVLMMLGLTLGSLAVGGITQASCVESCAEAVVGEQAVAALRDKTVLLAGATGNNGQVILAQLRELGINVRALTRNPAAAAARFGDDIDWVEADVTDPDSLVEAVNGVDVVISAIATTTGEGPNRPEMVDYHGNRNLAIAAQAAGATRFVIITTSIVDYENHFLNTIGQMLHFKHRAEQFLMTSGLEYVVVGPAGIDRADGGQKSIEIRPRADYQLGQRITSGDLASVVIASAALPEAANRVFSVANGSGPAGNDWQQQLASMPHE